MLPIYICEDDIQQLKIIKDSIELYFSIKHPEINIHIHQYKDPYKFLKNFNEASYPNIYFLDYMLNSDINGLDVARKIREKDAIGPITFISNYNDCWNESYKYQVSAMNFIYKRPDELQVCISNALTASIKFYETYLSQIGLRSKNICTIKSGRTLHQIDESDIIFFENSKTLHLIDIYTNKLIIHPRNTVSGILNVLSSDFFFQCNRSVVININYIKTIDTKNLTLQIYDRTFNISKPKLKELKNKLSTHNIII